MRVLFDNVLNNAVITSLYESDNYPASNIADEYLERRYQKTSDSVDTIICVLDSVYKMDCFFFGYTNTGQMVARFYGADGSLLNTETITGSTDRRITTDGSIRVTTDGDVRVTINPMTDTAYSVYFDDIYVKTIEIDIYGSSGSYLGGAGAGLSEELENVDASWGEGFVDNTVVTESPYGQSTREYIRPMDVDQWTLRAYTRERINDIKELYRRIGRGAKVWVDLTEDNHDFRAPYFARITEVFAPVKTSRYYSFAISVQEAR